MELAKWIGMSTHPSPSTPPPAAASQPNDLGAEIRRTAKRAARQSRAEEARHNAAATLEQSAREQRLRLARKKRFLGILVGVFVLLSVLNLAGLGMLRSARLEPGWLEL